jgi:sialic acid synthase SpsE/mannose-6-phosphate isomerase-like protein (cupin superfamily)
MIKHIPNNLFVLELANNHMGDVSHGIEVIRQFGVVCRQFPEFNFAIKLQYRDLETFVHPAMKSRIDLKYIKRFSETKLTIKEFDLLIQEIRANGFFTMCTPFDNVSVDVIETQNIDIIKIASCSFTDWPLLERAVKNDLPIVASTAGATLEQIDNVVSFFTHRNKKFAILHCVGEYPTKDEKLHINQIDLLKNRYPTVRIGFSTHENPANTDIVKMAIAKGVNLFEKHVGIQTQQYPLNAYSANPEQVKSWLEAARFATTVCGIGEVRLPQNVIEKESLLTLRRGVYVNRNIEIDELLTEADFYFAFPPEEGQFTANDCSKYVSFKSTKKILKDEALKPGNVNKNDNRDVVLNIAKKVKNIILQSQITIPGGVDLEISHHYGIEKFDEYGLTLITVVNRSYCKKILVSLPHQKHPEQYHNQKEETFHVLFGELHLTLNGQTNIYQPGNVIVIEPKIRHQFVSPTGCVIEEISSTHFKNDSFYTDESINQNSHRKTFMTYWME